MSGIMQPYHDLLKKIIDDGIDDGDRTGTGTRKLFGESMKFDLREGFPLVSSKKVFTRGIIEELIWFLDGATSVLPLTEKGVHIWDDWIKNETFYDQIPFDDRPIVKVKPPLLDKSTKLLKSGDFDPLETMSKNQEECYQPEYIWKMFEEMLKDVDVNNDVYIDSRLLDVEFFNDAVSATPGFVAVVDTAADFRLCNNYYGIKLYHPDTMVFLSSEEINLYESKDTDSALVKAREKGYVTHRFNPGELADNEERIPNTLDSFNMPENMKFVFRMALGKGDLGPIYGHQWRRQNIDQIAKVVHTLKNSPSSRQMVTASWNPNDLDEMALPPCHCLFQFQSEPIPEALQEENGPTRYLNLVLYQRSGDAFLGIPFNIAQYAMLLTMVAKVCNMQPKTFTHFLGDVHIYHNHFDAVYEQLNRKTQVGPVPKFAYTGDWDDSVGDFVHTAEDFIISDYEPASAILAPVAV